MPWPEGTRECADAIREPRKTMVLGPEHVAVACEATVNITSRFIDI